MPRALVIYCHPKPDSFTAAVKSLVHERLAAAGAEVRLRDLYGEGFDPVLSAQGHSDYEDTDANRVGLEKDIADLAWCDTLIFVYPTWWYGLPAVLKGWLDRAFVPGSAFHLPNETNKTIRPGFQHIKRLGVFTTCGASFWLTYFVGAPGKRTILRGIGLLCAKPLRKAYAAHYLMHTSTQDSRKAHLDRVARKLDRLIG